MATTPEWVPLALALEAQTLMVSSALWLLSPSVRGEKHSTEKAPEPAKKSE